MTEPLMIDIVERIDLLEPAAPVPPREKADPLGLMGAPAVSEDRPNPGSLSRGRNKAS